MYNRGIVCVYIYIYIYICTQYIIYIHMCRTTQIATKILHTAIHPSKLNAATRAIGDPQYFMVFLYS
jgi:hypothetical protein